MIDEAAFTKDGDNRSDDSMMAIWEKGIKPTLFDYGGEALVCSNSAGRNPDNFFFNICTDPQYGFREFHATTLDNPLLPKRAANESVEAWCARRARFLEDLRKRQRPAGLRAGIYGRVRRLVGRRVLQPEKLLVDNKPLPLPGRCDAVFAVIDTASKTGTDNDATAVTFFAIRHPRQDLSFHLGLGHCADRGRNAGKLVAERIRSSRRLARAVSARRGSIGAFIEDKNSGTILLQQALRRQMPAHAIEIKLTAMGKDERAISVSGYVHRELVKYTERAFHKTVIYKRHSRNHLLDQVESFRVGDRDGDREDDLLDTFCYGVAMALGNSEGF